MLLNQSMIFYRWSFLGKRRRRSNSILHCAYLCVCYFNKHIQKYTFSGILCIVDHHNESEEEKNHRVKMKKKKNKFPLLCLEWLEDENAFLDR